MNTLTFRAFEITAGSSESMTTNAGAVHRIASAIFTAIARVLTLSSPTVGRAVFLAV